MLRIFLFCGLTLIAGGREHSDPKLQRVQTNAVRQQLELRTTEIKQAYCSRTNLRLRLRFQFTNVGPAPVILYRHSRVVSRYMIAKSMNDSARGKYEYDVSPMINPRMPPVVEGPPDETSLFVGLKQGESFDLEGDVHLATSDGTKHSKGTLRPGQHVMRIAVVTWYDLPESARQLSERWSKFGLLWTNSVFSEPMPFVIENYTRDAECQ